MLFEKISSQVYAIITSTYRDFRLHFCDFLDILEILEYTITIINIVSYNNNIYNIIRVLMDVKGKFEKSFERREWKKWMRAFVNVVQLSFLSLLPQSGKKNAQQRDTIRFIIY